MKRILIKSLLIFLFTSTFINTQTLKREDIDNKYKWNLEDLYSSVDEWQQDKTRIENRIDEITKYKGKLAERADNLLYTLTTMYGIYREFSKFSSYASRLKKTKT
ncbi:MAG: hypothetical protein GXO85_02460 [Chlorobi bacterium]|nr:hypothetical protein [Chlorobiota bacterium]